nr:immunoglobulin light chain junction region [Macaca mulatta]MOW73077.1 immunoglobulin light chain junction region [Macaca mulatta]MOW73138.1 immunoglobulin light chain junction region [Macaca mulatta]MOW73271.1 immunoglobulin light chain junction region [Macaca mulatta]MOW73630.1 immunoglobulin light chain junction region [Macaca mulatta]
CMQAIQLPYTS